MRLAAPTTPFDLSEPRLREVRDFVRKAQAGALPGPNGIPLQGLQGMSKTPTALMETAESGVETGSSTIFLGRSRWSLHPKEDLSKLLNSSGPYACRMWRASPSLGC